MKRLRTTGLALLALLALLARLALLPTLPTVALAAGPAQGGAPAQSPSTSRLSFYAYSRDSEAGFRDEMIDVFRRELGKHLESVGELAYDRASADVSVQYLGQGELTVELSSGIGPVRYLWREDDQAPRMWALVRVGTFGKEFSLEGSGGRDMSRLARSVADWIQENAAAIRRSRETKE